MPLFDAAFVCGLHEGFDLLICLGVQQRLQPLLLGLVQLRVSLQAFGQEEPPKIILSRTGDPFQPLGVQLGPPVRRQPHQGAQRHPQQVLARRVRLAVQGRQADVGVLEADDPLLPEVLLVRVPADAVEPDAQEQGDRQHRQPGVAPQLDVVLEHPRPEGQRCWPATPPRDGPGPPGRTRRLGAVERRVEMSA